jgi:superfamily II DNA or RNA helicase
MDSKIKGEVRMNLLWEDDIELSEEKIAEVAAQQIVIRDYQQEAVASVFDEWSRVRSTLLCLPTGTGKSVCFSEIMKQWNGERMMLIAHRKELIYQAVGHATRAGLSCGIEMAHRYAKPTDRVVVSSIQTLISRYRCRACRGDDCEVCGGSGKVKRFTRFNRDEFGLVVIDEGHHATAKSYRSVLAWFDRCKHLLVTATPKRTDKVGLHNVCDSTAYSMTLRQAIDLGWLVPVRQRYVTVKGLDLESVSIVGGDLDDGERERAYLGDSDEREDSLLHGVAKPFLAELKSEQGIIFASGQEHAKKLTAALNSYPGVYAACVLDDTLPADRERIVDEFRRGTIRILVNCMVFAEGFDAPATSVIGNCRPTKSQTILAQFIGRGTRPLPGVVDGPLTPEERKQAIANSAKPRCLVLDFVGATGRLRLATTVDLLAGDDVDPIDLEEAVRVSREEGDVDPVEALERAKAARKERERAKEAEKLLVTKRRAASIEYSADEVDDTEFESYHQTIRRDSITRGQLNLLVRRLGYNASKIKHLSKKAASREITKALAIARGKAKKSYQDRFQTAQTMGDLHCIGGQIKRAIEYGDVVMKDAGLQQQLRESFRKRAKELRGS